MGFESRIELVDTKMRRGQVAAVRRYIKEHKDDRERFHYFLRYLRIDDGFLDFDYSEASGKWYEDEAFARRLVGFIEQGGRVILHSQEGDGTVWGWVFDGQGKMRALSLKPTGRWR